MTGIVRIRFAGFVALCIVLASCDTDRSAGNNGTSTDNVLAARDLSVDSIAGVLAAPDAGAYPLLVALDSTDIDFSRTLPHGADLEVGYVDSAPLPFQIREWDARGKAASLWVRIPRQDLWKWRTVRIAYGDGQDRSAQDSAATWEGVTPAMRAAVTSVLLADFEQDTLRPLLPRQTTDWYVGWSFGTIPLRPSSGEHLEPAAEYDAVRKSKVVHLSWSAPPGGWFLFGARLGTREHRLSSLDSIVFWAKGDGVVRVALEDGRDTSDLAKAWIPIQLDTAWRRYCVKPSQFDAPDAWNIGWDAVKTRVNTFTIFGVSGSKLWVDDVRLYGVGAWELQ